MNLSVTDWLIVLFVFCGMIYSVNTTKGLMKSVTDFLAAGRTAGRYVVSISSGIAGSYDLYKASNQVISGAK